MESIIHIILSNILMIVYSVQFIAIVITWFITFERLRKIIVIIAHSITLLLIAIGLLLGFVNNNLDISIILIVAYAAGTASSYVHLRNHPVPQ